MAKWNISMRDCSQEPALDCTAIYARAGGPSAADASRLQEFVSKAVAAGLSRTVPVEMATAALRYMDSFDARCAALNEGKLPHLRRPSATEASLKLLLATAKQLLVGIENLLELYASAYEDHLAKQV